MKKINKFTKVATAFLLSICFIAFSISATYAQENTQNAKYVYLGGESFGIKMFAKGAIIVKLEDISNGTSSYCPAKECGIEENDVVISANNVSIISNEQLKDIIESSNGKEIDLIISRNEKEIKFSVKPQKNYMGIYKIGAWVRDSCAGIGTISYYDQENSTYAALGHGVCDIDTKEIMPLSKGNIVETKISGITKAQRGTTGTLNGYLTDNEIGNLFLNTELGIYGKYNNSDFLNTKQKLQVAQIDEVETGPATIYSTIDNTGIQEFKAEITSFGDNSCNTNKNFVIKILDEKLLNVTGGIVQGMSGSPVVQNDKLVGVVNHVLINTPEKGYCVFAQNMVSNFSNTYNILYEKVA